MNKMCPGCGEPVRFWHKKRAGNSSWHHRCMITSHNAHAIANEWSERECTAVGLPTPWELYQTKGSIGERYAHLLEPLLEKYHLTEWYEQKIEGKKYVRR